MSQNQQQQILLQNQNNSRNKRDTFDKISDTPGDFETESTILFAMHARGWERLTQAEGCSCSVLAAG